MSGRLRLACHRQTKPAHSLPVTEHLTVPARLKRVGREMRMVVEGADDQTAADPSLLRVIARGHDIQRRHRPDGTRHHARGAGDRRLIYTLLRLLWLAPDITTAIVYGRQPQQLSAKTLMRKVSRLPADWTEQRTLLGF